MSALAETGALQRDLSAIVGEQNVAQESPAINGIVPAYAVTPASAEEIAALLSFANRRGLVVAPAGNFTKQDIGGIPDRIDILLRTQRLSGIQKYDPGDLTISINAGTPFSEIQSALAEHQQWLPYDAPNLEHSTVGGCMATGAAGPLKHAFGGLRDFCIGVHFATADGRLGKGGGMVVKNVAGYDLMKLMTGSYGSLAVITRANFKVFPRPRQTRTFVCCFGSLDEALKFREKIFASPLQPICLEVLSPRTTEYLSDAPVPEDPDHYAPSHPVALASKVWQIVLRAGGSENILTRYKRELGAAVSAELEGAAEDRFWDWISKFEYSVLGRHQNAMVIYTHSPITDIGP
ncbi:MAG: FAD-binding oxidoreductase, partial [Candidatus Angelobacter sp.]